MGVTHTHTHTPYLTVYCITTDGTNICACFAASVEGEAVYFEFGVCLYVFNRVCVCAHVFVYLTTSKTAVRGRDGGERVGANGERAETEGGR